jgi:hypothetical protein
MVQGTERLRIAAIRSSDLQPTEGSALRPLRARARHPERAANQRKYWSESRSPSQSSNSADRFPNGKVLSSPLRPCQGKGPVVFPLVSVLLVGATGFEPVTSSVSAKPREPLCYTPFSQVGPDLDAKGKRSLDVKGNALFRHSTLPLLHVLLTSGGPRIIV